MKYVNSRNPFVSRQQKCLLPPLLECGLFRVREMVRNFLRNSFIN